MSKCIVCDGYIVLKEGTEKAEIIECPECGIELEVRSINPITFAELPESKEDWGE